MSKQGITKEKILELISEGNDNLSEISEKLDLAPSTVSKHIHDLESANAIEQKSNPHVKKWKYYKIKGDSAAAMPKGNGFSMKRNPIAFAAIACALVALFALSYVYAGHASSGTTYVPVSITDPPIVPSGTQALYINYTSVSVHATYDGKSEWIPLNTSGRLELMSLINESQVIGEVGIASNSTIDQAEFNISSASITVDNVTYPVTVTKRQIVATVINGKEINDTSGVLLDFSPVVTPVYFENATKFVMDPSLRAAMIPGFGSGMQVQPGSGQQFPLQRKYSDLFKGNDANLTIANASMNSAENETSLDITLKNNGNSSVTVVGAILMGDVSPYLPSNAQAFNGIAPEAAPGNAMGINCSQVKGWPGGSDRQTAYPEVSGGQEGAGMNATGSGAPPEGPEDAAGAMGDNRIGPGSGFGKFGGGAGQLDSGAAMNISNVRGQEPGAPLQNAPGAAGTVNASQLGRWRAFNESGSNVTINMSRVIRIGKACGFDKIRISLPASSNAIQISGIGDSSGWADSYGSQGMMFASMHPVGVSFFVEDNATLSVQLPWRAFNQTPQSGGYVLAPGATVTLEYTGKLSVGGMKAFGGSGQNDSRYAVTVLTDRGVVQENFTYS
jgi:hypothetical protein